MLNDGKTGLTQPYMSEPETNSEWEDEEWIIQACLQVDV